LIKVILADGQALYRAGMVRVLSAEEEFRIVAQCPDLNRLYSAIRAFSVATVIVSSALRSELTTLLGLAREAGSQVIMVAEDSESYHPYCSMGVSGVVYRSTTSASFLDCVRQVNRGGQFHPPSPAMLEEDLVGSRAKAQLTAKELKIIALLVDGMRNREIAERLNTTEQVVKNMLRNIYDKTGVSDRLELALFTLHHSALARAAAQVSAEMQLQQV
jgi:DNA-binding NarL/FixJ family response regulator